MCEMALIFAYNSVFRHLRWIDCVVRKPARNLIDGVSTSPIFEVEHQTRLPRIRSIWRN